MLYLRKIETKFINYKTQYVTTNFEMNGKRRRRLKVVPEVSMDFGMVLYERFSMEFTIISLVLLIFCF